ncbi:hypothetical protein ACP3WW_24165, partial [Salmonella enterica]|uniref:hypothetical protein n=1 Tax=Salmonella enterica TaxID=28901 RepID=UPI003CEC86C6
ALPHVRMIRHGLLRPAMPMSCTLSDGVFLTCLFTLAALAFAAQALLFLLPYTFLHIAPQAASPLALRWCLRPLPIP